MLHWAYCIYCVYVTKDKFAVILSSGYEISKCLSHGESQEQVSYGGYETDRVPAGGVKRVDTDGWSLGGEGWKMWREAFCCMLC